MKIKIFTSIFTAVFLFGLLLTNTSHASVKDAGMIKEKRVQISITNDQTGETTFIDPKEIKTINSLSNDSDNDSVVEGYEVFIPIEVSNPSDITPASVGQVKDEYGVKAELYADYDLSSDKKEVRVNKIWGSWTPSHSMYIVSNRKVEAHSSTFWGKKLSETPSKNTFTYPTGWGYNTRVLGDGGPRAWNSAKITIDGMSGSSYTIELDFNFAN